MKISFNYKKRGELPDEVYIDDVTFETSHLVGKLVLEELAKKDGKKSVILQHFGRDVNLCLNFGKRKKYINLTTVHSIEICKD